MDSRAWPGSPGLVPTKIGLDENPGSHPVRSRLGTQTGIRGDIPPYPGYQTGP